MADLLSTLMPSLASGPNKQQGPAIRMDSQEGAKKNEEQNLNSFYQKLSQIKNSDSQSSQQPKKSSFQSNVKKAANVDSKKVVIRPKAEDAVASDSKSAASSKSSSLNKKLENLKADSDKSKVAAAEVKVSAENDETEVDVNLSAATTASADQSVEQDSSAQIEENLAMQVEDLMTSKTQNSSGVDIDSLEKVSSEKAAMDSQSIEATLKKLKNSQLVSNFQSEKNKGVSDLENTPVSDLENADVAAQGASKKDEKSLDSLLKNLNDGSSQKEVQVEGARKELPAAPSLKNFADHLFVQNQLQMNAAHSKAPSALEVQNSSFQSALNNKMTGIQLASDMRAFLESMSSNQKSGEINLSLRPASLGLVKVGIEMQQGSVRIMIEAAEAPAKEVLQSQVGELKDQLKQNGLKVDEIRIGSIAKSADANDLKSTNKSTNDEQSSQNSQQNPGEQQQRQSSMNQYQREYHQSLRQRSARELSASESDIFENIQSEVAAA